MSLMNSALSRFLDAARWISALMVVLDHLNNVMIVHLRQLAPGQRSTGMYLFGFLSGFGHPAVIVFFTLSGFLVGGKLVRQVRSGTEIDLKRYLVDRVARIHLVLIPTLLLVVILDVVGARWFGATHAYNNAHLDIHLAEHLTPMAFFGTLFNLQNIFVPFLGTDGPLGTLANEFWYYLTFPLLLMPWIKGVPAWVKTFGFSLGLTLLVGFTIRLPWHGIGFALWMVGVAASTTAKPLVRNRMWAVAIFCLVTVGLRLALRESMLAKPVISISNDLFIALLFAACIDSFRHSTQAPGKFLSSNLHMKIAGFSYSMYAVHFSLLVLLCAGEQSLLGFGLEGLPTRWWHWALLVANVVVTFMFANLFAMATERDTAVVRQKLYRLCRIETAQPALRPATGLAVEGIQAPRVVLEREVALQA